MRIDINRTNRRYKEVDIDAEVENFYKEYEPIYTEFIRSGVAYIDEQYYLDAEAIMNHEVELPSIIKEEVAKANVHQSKLQALIDKYSGTFTGEFEGMSSEYFEAKHILNDLKFRVADVQAVWTASLEMRDAFDKYIAALGRATGMAY